jgi:uncharacterized SAM-binding protein YcdF (DUF218 family)
VIIILGGGTSDTLNPVLYTKERLEFFVKKVKIYSGVPIIVSGKYSLWMKKKPKYTEADVMESYLLKFGLPKKSIIKENNSRDTVGNIYHSKQIIKKHPEWSKILVVTTKGHDQRSHWLLKKIFGKEYTLKYLKAPSHLPSFKTNPGRKKYEQYIISIYKKVLKDVNDGDDKKIMNILKQEHPAYSNSPSAKKLEKAILAAKLKFMGYLTLPKQ